MQKTEQKELSCIFGKEIRDKCVVRAELERSASPDINKWVKSKNNTVFDEASELLDKMVNVNNALAVFCEMCPHLTLYMEKHSLLVQSKTNHP